MNNKILPLTLDDFTHILKYAQIKHAELEEPIPNMGSENMNKIKSCLDNPFQTFGEKDLYKGFLDKATILFYSIIKGHALINGNKRMAILALVFFSYKNDRMCYFSDEQFYLFAREVAKSTDPDKAIKYVRRILGQNIFVSGLRMRPAILIRRVKRKNRAYDKMPMKFPIVLSKLSSKRNRN